MEALFINGAFELVPSWIVNAEAVVRANARPARRKRPIPPPDFLDIGNVAEHMRGGMKPPAMLVKGWLQRGALHWLQGQPEHGKSWVPLWLAKQVMKENPRARVLWMDGEMGSATLADRLLALGMDPDVIENQLVHVNLTTVPRGQFDEFITWVVRRRFQLVVWDPMAQHLAGADLSEQSNSEVAQWLAAMVNPVSAYGGTTIAVDHISKTASADDPRGAGAKKARARIIYAVARRNRFDRRTRGEIEIECVKNSDSADVVRYRRVLLGGDPFEWRVLDEDSRIDGKLSRMQTAQDLRAVVSALDAAGKDGLSQRKLVSAVGGYANRIRRLLQRLAAEPGLQEDYELGRRIACEWRKPEKGGTEALWFWLES